MTKVLALVHDKFEDIELMYPSIRLQEEGIKVTYGAEESGHIYKGKYGYPCRSNAAFKNLKSSDFDGIIIPGGFAPDHLRWITEVIKIVQEMHKASKMIAFICHGGWVPISAMILKGKKVTGTIAIKDDFENAGAIWQDVPLVIDGNLISSRNPGDLPQFGKAIIKALK